MEHLFQVIGGGEAEFLEEDQSELLHNSVSKLLLMRSRYRRYIQMVLSFLTTRVNIPDENYWGKMK